MGHQWRLDAFEVYHLVQPLVPGDVYASCLLLTQQIHDVSDRDPEAHIVGISYFQYRCSVVSLSACLPEYLQMNSQTHLDAQTCWPFPLVSALQNIRTAQPGVSPILEAAKAQLPFLSIPPGTYWLNSSNLSWPKAAGIPLDKTPKTELWLYEILFAVTHELTHCFGLPHCTDYDCLIEDAGNNRFVLNLDENNHSFLDMDNAHTPYLCPPCLEKLMYMIHCEPNISRSSGTRSTPSGVVTLADQHQRARVEIIRYARLLRFCYTKKDNPILTAYAAWLHHVLKCYDQSFVQTVLCEVGLDWEDSSGDVVMVDHEKNASFSLPP